MQPLSRFEIDLTAVRHNVGRIHRAIGDAVGICAVLKADAYGLGAVRVASQLNRAGVDMFAVYTPQQAQVVLRARVSRPVLVLTPVREPAAIDGLEGALAADMVHLAVHDRSHITELERIAAHVGGRLGVHVEADTGMARGGVTWEASLDVIRAVHDSPHLHLAGLYAHLASADCDATYTCEQAQAFDALLERARPAIPDECVIHEASTFGVLRGRRHHRQMVRVGLLWAGYGPEEYVGRPECPVDDLRPILRWTSRIVHVKTIQASTRVGYGGIWRAARTTRLALVGVGYADGYPAALSCADDEPAKGELGFRLPDGTTAYAPVVGRVSMDQITVDVTDLPMDTPVNGAEVEVVGRDPQAPNHLPTLARRAGTITHELLCRLGPPIHRTYITEQTACRFAPAHDTSSPVAAHEQP
ncbi:MAG: alanine racemase [Phycisphaerales bacterium]|nr:alanine racemase [Phycisphaerales bacterium]